MTIEQELKALIVKRYGSAKNFALEINMPNSTLDNIFRRGVLNSSVTNIIKICNALECSLRDILTDPATLEGLDEYDKRRS